MQAHAWMNKDLDQSVKLNAEVKKSLYKYVSIRRDKSQKYKKDNDAANIDDQEM